MDSEIEKTIKAQGRRLYRAPDTALYEKRYHDLLLAKKTVGIKQSQRAVEKGEARIVYAAQDADPDIIDPFLSLCRQKKVEVVKVDSMKNLGQMCGIDVPASVAAII